MEKLQVCGKATDMFVISITSLFLINIVSGIMFLVLHSPIVKYMFFSVTLFDVIVFPIISLALWLYNDKCLN